MRDLAEGIETAGDPHSVAQVLAALREVVDPEISLGILEVGLVYGVTVDEGMVHIRLTMTSAACPMADLIIDDIEERLRGLLAPETAIAVELCWDPPWTPQRMSDRARRAMGWD